MAAKAFSSALPSIEDVAAALHNSEMMANKNAGRFSVKLPSGEETVVPYDQLSDTTKASIQDRVRVVYNAIDAAVEVPKTHKAG